MTTATIMARLRANFAEIPGITRAFQYTPTTPVDLADMPAVVPVQLGRMMNPIPRPSTTTGMPQGAGQYIVERQYIYRILIAPQQAAGTDSGDDGAIIDANAAAVIDAVIDYFMQHPRLSTASLADIPTLAMDVQIQDSGIVTRLGPGGAQYRCIDYTINVQERRIPASKRLS